MGIIIMKQNRSDFGRRISARDKLNAVALRGAFAVGGVIWAVTGELWIGLVAAALAASACYVGGELR